MSTSLACGNWEQALKINEACRTRGVLPYSAGFDELPDYIKVFSCFDGSFRVSHDQTTDLLKDLNELEVPLVAGVPNVAHNTTRVVLQTLTLSIYNIKRHIAFGITGLLEVSKFIRSFPGPSAPNGLLEVSKFIRSFPGPSAPNAARARHPSLCRRTPTSVMCSNNEAHSAGAWARYFTCSIFNSIFLLESIN